MLPQGRSRAAAGLTRKTPGAGKYTVRGLNTHRGCDTHTCIHLAARSGGASLPSPKLLSKSQPEELDRLFLVCSAKSPLEKQGSESGAHDSKAACALFPRSPSLRPAGAGYTQLLRAGTVTHDLHIFQTPQFPWFLIPFQKLYLSLAQGRMWDVTRLGHQAECAAHRTKR